MLEEIFTSRSKVKILKLLVDRPEWIFTESEIARELSMPRTTAHRTLKTLRNQNIVRQLKKGGNVTICQLNGGNYLVKDLIEPFLEKDNVIILEKSKEFCKEIKELIVVGILFGSATTNKMKPTSDIDLALVTNDPKKLKKEVEKLKTKLFEKEEIIFSTHIFSTNEFRNRYNKRDPLVREMADGIIVYGSIEDVI